MFWLEQTHMVQSCCKAWLPGYRDGKVLCEQEV